MWAPAGQLPLQKQIRLAPRWRIIVAMARPLSAAKWRERFHMSCCRCWMPSPVRPIYLCWKWPYLGVGWANQSTWMRLFCYRQFTWLEFLIGRHSTLYRGFFRTQIDIALYRRSYANSSSFLFFKLRKHNSQQFLSVTLIHFIILFPTTAQGHSLLSSFNSAVPNSVCRSCFCCYFSLVSKIGNRIVGFNNRHCEPQLVGCSFEFQVARNLE